MKKHFQLLGFGLVVVLVSVFTSCDSGDDVDDIIDDIVNEGPKVGDGVYVVGAAISADTTTANKMTPAEVAAPDFQTQPRPGLFEAYVHLKNGSFGFMVVEGEEVTTYAGAWEETPVGEVFMATGALTEGGTPATTPEVGTNGKLAHVLVDFTTNQYFVIPVEYWEIIGDATEAGWNSGQRLDVKTTTDEQVVYEATGVTLRGPNKFFKIRHNSIWNVDLAPGCQNAEEACLNFNTNFGGAMDDLVSGGSNIGFAGGDGVDGVYTVTVTYEPGEGNSLEMSIVRTGDAEEITYDPADYPWGIIGAALDAETGWNADIDLNYHNWTTPPNWAGVFYLYAGAFKFRTDEGWSNELNPNNTNATLESSITTSGGDFVNGQAGLYMVRINTQDEAATWNLEVKSATPELIGDAQAGDDAGQWDAGKVMSISENAETITWTLTDVALEAGKSFKFRYNGGWEVNFGFAQITEAGTSASALAEGSDNNYSVATAGTYDITLSTSDKGVSFTLTIE